MKINFADNLKELRKCKGITQKQLAEMLEVDQRTISAWENRICEPDFSTLARICDIFEEDFNGLLQ